MKVRSYDTEQGLMVAVCDTDLLGETFREDGIKLEITEEFYGGETVPKEEVEGKLEAASIANLVGEKAVDTGIDVGIIDEDKVLYVEGVPHAQMVRI